MMSEQLKPGDRVYVTDPGLAAIRDIMRRATGKEPAPNHHGTVSDERWDSDDSVLIVFDDGVSAPYPLNEVRLLPAAPAQGDGRTG